MTPRPRRDSHKHDLKQALSGFSGSELSRAVGEEIRRIASEKSDLPLKKVHLDSRLIEDLNMDSLALTEFFMCIEDEFGVSMDDDAGRNVFIGNISTLGDVADAVLAQWGTGTPSRTEWQTRVPHLFETTLEPFTQLSPHGGPVVQHPQFLAFGTNPEGFSQYQRTSDGMRCVLLPEAIATIGSEEPGAYFDQRPQHKVPLRTFLIDAEPVSNAAYARFLNSAEGVPNRAIGEWFGVHANDTRGEHVQVAKNRGRWEPVPGTGQYPVVLVSWYGANAYSLWVNGFDWRYYRGDGTVPADLPAATTAVPAPTEDTLFSMLPSEAQWEYAARGKDYAPFPWGQDSPQQVGVDVGRHRIGAHYQRDELPTVPVNARMGMSPFGLHHMAGNVWQWCRDWYSPDFYSSASATRPDAQNGEPTGIRSERGGSWVGPAELARSSYRRGRTPSARGRCLGIRCISVPPNPGS